MENWLYASLPVLLETAASSVGIMIVVLLIVRFYGLRSLAKMSSVDFASTVAIGSILASVTVNTDTSLLKGGLAMFVILGFQQVFSIIKRQSDAVENLTENNPVFLMRGSTIIQSNLDKTGVTRADLMAKLREANVVRLSEVKAVVFETTGDVSVLHGKDEHKIDDELLENVYLSVNGPLP